ncbi:sulfotransferase domain-containing protein [Gimesia fumaroli]|uniref:Sulfotransferase domain protein n=1 Tax=Gimesia fumaroli TaxID=2527976 RepID=A0A518I5C7_9PLAN|nr:sulfotransferase domain-containing protein [Gimesia fumaroli]QDV48255.1 Sulfotransferase domain protein [Gimesia fumaroli]
MIIFNFGIPNSGTDWSQEVFKKIWESQNLSFQSEEAHTLEELNQIIGTMNVNERMILRFHLLTEEAIEAAQQDAVRPFYHYRDPRDVVCTEMQNSDTPFATAVDQTVAAYQEIHHALCLPGIMVIPYEHLADNAEGLIYQMATKLGVLLKLDAVSAIADEMRAMQAEPQYAAATSTGGDAFASQSVRIDGEHSEESSFVQPLMVGKWRNQLTQSEKSMVTRFFKPLVDQFGYDT